MQCSVRGNQYRAILKVKDKRKKVKRVSNRDKQLGQKGRKDSLETLISGLRVKIKPDPNQIVLREREAARKERR